MFKLRNVISQHKGLVATVAALVIAAAVVLPLIVGGGDEGEPTPAEVETEDAPEPSAASDRGSQSGQGGDENKQPSPPEDEPKPSDDGGGGGGQDPDPQPDTFRGGLREAFGSDVVKELDREDVRSVKRQLEQRGGPDELFVPGTPPPPGGPQDYFGEGG